MIKATAKSDDGRFKAEFDATQWFEQASPEAVYALAQDGWGGNYEADSIVYFFEGVLPNVGNIVRFCLASAGGTEEPIGFICEIDAKDAMAWLKKNWPEMLDAIYRDTEENQFSVSFYDATGAYWSISNDGKGDVNVFSDAKEGCPNCFRADCYYDCDQSQGDDSLETDEEVESRKEFNTAIAGIESLVRALVREGLDFTDQRWLDALSMAVIRWQEVYEGST